MGRGSSKAGRTAKNSSTGTLNELVPFTYAVTHYKAQIASASMLQINPQSKVAQFYANEAPVTPRIMDFASGVSGTDSQLQNYYSERYHKQVKINRNI